MCVCLCEERKGEDPVNQDKDTEKYKEVKKKPFISLSIIQGSCQLIQPQNKSLPFPLTSYIQSCTNKKKVLYKNCQCYFKVFKNKISVKKKIKKYF